MALARVRALSIALLSGLSLLALPALSAASTGGGDGNDVGVVSVAGGVCMIEPWECGPEEPCFIEPWECDPEGPEPPEEPCMIEPWECGGDNPCMIEPWECVDEGPVICEEGLGRYIIVFEDWVEDPEALAYAQTEQYGGKLGFIYKYALKGYSAGYSAAAVEALRNDPTVDYIEVDQPVYLDSATTSGWEDCAPEEPEPPILEKDEAGDVTAPSGGDGTAGIASALSQSDASGGCAGNQVRRGGRCIPALSLARRVCRKQEGLVKRRCIRRAIRELGDLAKP